MVVEGRQVVATPTLPLTMVVGGPQGVADGEVGLLTEELLELQAM